MPLAETIHFELNGRPTEATVPVSMSTLSMLRDVLEMTGTKYGCGEGECGACTILVDDLAINACLMFAVDCDGRSLTTIEGLRKEEGLGALQEAFVRCGAVQCGFCTPGFIVQGTYLLRRTPDASQDDIKRGIEGNLCRCTGYKKIVDAIASALSQGGGTRTDSRSSLDVSRMDGSRPDGSGVDRSSSGRPGMNGTDAGSGAAASDLDTGEERP